MTLGQRIREAREAKGLTRDALQRAVGSASGTVTRWERDERVPRAEYLSAMSRTLDVRETWLLTGGPRERASDPSGGPLGLAALELVLETYDWVAVDASVTAADEIIALARAEATTPAGLVRPQSAWRLFLTRAVHDRVSSRRRPHSVIR